MVKQFRVKSNKMVYVWRGLENNHIYVSPFDECFNPICSTPFTRQLDEYFDDKTQDVILKHLTCNGLLYGDYAFYFDI